MATVIELRPELWPQAVLHAGGAKRRAARRSAPAAACDPHVGWLRRFVDERNRCNHAVHEADGDAHFDEAQRLADLLQTTPARSLEGAIARLALLIDESLVNEVPISDTAADTAECARSPRIDNWEAQWSDQPPAAALGDTRKPEEAEGMTGLRLIDVSDALADDSALCGVAYLATMKLNELHDLGPCGDALTGVLRRLSEQLDARERQMELLMAAQGKPPSRGLRPVQPDATDATAS